ncbi:tail fiber assembly protein, partial [Xenorhabdus bovienii]|uniref:tail fiber assembly protein n=1 Tax=Xenorhabdus bovienii TaxID=40576 RepID=UPI0023B30700
NNQQTKMKPKFDNDWFYSAIARGFIYRPDEQPGNYPDDLKPISDELYREMFDGQSNGKLIVPGADGLPTLVDLPPPTPEQLRQKTEYEKRYLLKAATEKIDICQDAVDLNIATDSEKSSLAEWRKYRVLLNRVDCTTAPDIIWPEPPK